MDPVERQINRISKGINGISPQKLRAINEASRANAGTTTSSYSSSNVNIPNQNIPAQNQALAEQAKTYYPALLQQEKNLNKERLVAIKNLEKQKQVLGVVEDNYYKIVNAMNLINATGADTDTMIRSFNEEMKRLGVNLRLEEASMQNLTGILTDQRAAADKAAESVRQIDTQLESLKSEIAAAELGMTKFQKVIAKTGVVGKFAIGAIKTALYSIGIGLIIAGLVEAYN